MARVALVSCLVLISIHYAVIAQPWTITVTTAVDENDDPWNNCTPWASDPADCSLREAILVANYNGAPGDTIVFAASLDGATITLDSTLGSLWIGNDSDTTIDATALNNGITIDANGVQYPLVLDVSNITIQGPITITNAGAGGVAVVLNNPASNATLDGITVTGNPNVGIGVDDPANVIITNVTVTNNGSAGISLYGTGASNIQISNCTVSNNGGSGVLVAPLNVTIANCTINNNSNGGISIAASSGLVSVQNSTLDGNTGSSAIFSLANIYVSSSTITNNPVGGITLQGTNVGGSSIQNSTISDNGLGIFIGNAPGPTPISIRTNTISNNQGAGISISNSSNILIQTNSITNNGQDGISSGIVAVGTSTDITIWENTIANNGGNGITIIEDFANDTAPQSVRIFQNTISNNGYGPLAGDGVGIHIAGAVTGSDPSLCGGAGGSVAIFGNSIYGNAAQGILIERTPAGSNGPQNVCIGIGGEVDPTNYIYGNGQEGVLLRDPGTSNNIVANSYIGLDLGLTPAPNGNAGVSIYGGATNNIVEGNTIRYNQYQNVLISGAGTTGNIVRNNTIQGGIDSTPPQGYNNAGVVINNGASQNTIGPNNTIQYHYFDGIQVIGLGTDNNEIIQNTITNNGLGVAVLNTYPGSDGQIGPPTPGPANTWILQNVIRDNNSEGIFIRYDNGGTVIGENLVQNNNGEGVLLIGSSPSVQNNTITQNAANGILALVYFGADDSPSTANDDVLSQPYNIENNTITANGGFGIFALDTPLGDLSAINANNTWSPDNALARIQQDWYGYVRVVDASNNPVTGLTVQIDQNAPCAGSYTSAVSDPNGNYGPTGFTVNSERTYFQITEAFVNNAGALYVCTPQTVHDVPTTISGIYAYNGDYPNPPAEQGGAIESPPGSGIDRYQFALLIQELAVADLRVEKAADPDPVLVGNNLTYTITVTNLGPSIATNVILTDTLPSSVTFVSATPSQGSCNPPVGNVITCNLGNINANNTVTITIVVTPIQPGTITNTVTVSGDTNDPNPNNNTAQRDTTVEGPLGGDPPIWDALMVFPTPEQHFGYGPRLDLNSNKSLSDCVLRVRDLQTGRITNTGVFVSCAPRDLDLYEQTVALVTPEGKLGIYDLASGKLTTTAFDASHPAIFGEFVVFESAGQIALWDGKSVKLLGAGRDPVIWDQFVAFVGPSNTIQIYDLSRDELRDTGIEGIQPAIYEGVVAFVARDKHPVIQLYEIATGRLKKTEAIGIWPAIFGRYVVFETSEREIGSDLNGDGDRADTVIRYYDRERGRVFNTARVGSEPDIYDGLIAFWGYESSYGQDLNRDGDLLDPIVQTYRIPSETLSVPLRVTRIAIERADRQSVRFIVMGDGIEAVRLEIYDLQGRVLYRSEFVPGQRVIWYGRAQDGTVLANGVYLAVLTVKGADRVERSAVQKVVVLR